ncbi:MAG: hypothetical protein ACKOAE_04150, partial [Acidimicrobiaceae bacterium]
TDIEKKKAQEQGYSLNDDERYQVCEIHVDQIIESDPFKSDDDIALPYVITIEKGTNHVLAVRRNLNPDDKKHLKRQHFVQYTYIPGFGAYGFGLIHLIGGYARAGTALNAPTTSTATTTTTTTIPASQRKAVVTLKRSYGTYTGVSLKVSYTVEGNKDLRCTTLSKVLGEDFNGTRISYIYDIVQTTPEICTITVEYIGERDGDTREIILSAAPTFSITDTDGVVQTTLLGSPQSIWATRPAS